ncbi:MAG: lytic murein transglycosylase B [Mariprofundaceae bacterium]|nr:lytic murein transglycosylase B [Mariprofundaceae bacterium]
MQPTHTQHPKKNHKGLIVIAVIFTFICMASPLFAAEKKVEPFLSKQDLVEKLQAHVDLSTSRLTEILQDAKFQPSIIRRMNTPYEAQPYKKYRPLFVNNRLLKLGKGYSHHYQDIFKRAFKKYGVQKEIITAILGIETHYGRSQGKDKILDSLYTLASGFPRRSVFFTKELAHFIMLVDEEHLSLDLMKGSYAGAFGTTQFIPSSYRHYAVDANNDGRRDVWNNHEDIIFSVANYFHEHHWDPTAPIAYVLSAPLSNRALFKDMKAKETKEWHALSELYAAGLAPLPAPWKGSHQVAVVTLDTKEGIKHVIVHKNFYVITRWNRSYNYAMATAELATAFGFKP